MTGIPSSDWKNCSSCKKPIRFRTKYWTCNVSTCNRPGTSFAFCCVPCWDSHLPIYRHRESWAEERFSPGKEEAHQAAEAAQVAPQARPIPTKSASTEREILIVSSKLKEFIHSRSEMNTSASVMNALSEHVRRLCDQAIENAKRAGRKTVMDRDF